MKKIAFFTTSRAEFGILSPLIKALNNSEDFESLVFVGGTHLAKEHGYTIEEIQNLDINIIDKFDYLLNNNSNKFISISSGIAIIELAEIFSKHDFDFVCLLGDRTELLSIAINAIIFRKPIIHISGGETTLGAIDEQVRHMITKASHIHFATCEQYAKNICNLGESSWRVFNVGSLNADNMINNKKYTKKEIYRKLKLDVEKETVLLTYHPVTLNFNIEPVQQIRNIFKALSFYDFQVVVTAPNADNYRDIIYETIINHMDHENFFYFESLGTKKYHSLIPFCEFVIGNSSSGLTEVPYFKIPTVNIGDRQKGRIRHRSVINTDYSVESIKSGIKKALDSKFRDSLKNMKYKFGDGHAAERIVKVLKSTKVDQNLLRKKLEFPK